MENKIKINENDLFNVIFTNLRHLIELMEITPKDAVKICDGVINATKNNDTKIIEIGIDDLKIIIIDQFEKSPLYINEFDPVFNKIIGDVNLRKL